MTQSAEQPGAVDEDGELGSGADAELGLGTAQMAPGAQGRHRSRSI